MLNTSSVFVDRYKGSTPTDSRDEFNIILSSILPQELKTLKRASKLNRKKW
jgi:hypothetical protein